MSGTVQDIVRDMQTHTTHAHTGAAGGKGADLRLLRELNRLLVLNCVRNRGPIARVQVARRTGLSRTTISSIIDDLLAEGLVREGSLLKARSSGGRRAILLHFQEDAGYILGVDMGRSHFTMIITNLAAEVIARYSGPLNADLGPEVCIRTLVAEMRAFVAARHITWDHIIGIGVGIPGPLDARLSQLVSPPRMPGWDRFDMHALLRRELPVPIYLDNDANMGALGESRYGAGQGVADLAYIKLATGIGCGLVINGHIYRGSRGSAGEVGHVSIDKDGPVCDCGNRGCLETVAGASAIVRDACLGLSMGEARTDAAPTRQTPALAGESNVDIADVVQAALNGDPASRAAIESAGAQIGVALAGLINLVNPSVILVDGSVSRAGDLLLAPIREAIATRSLAAASTNTHIHMGRLKDNAIALGAVATVIDAAFGVPATPLAPGLAEVAEALEHTTFLARS